MSKWNSDLYLKFAAERTQPALDLANRIRDFRPKKAADIGCGPGNSTVILKHLFPDADLTGIDSSENMIEKARTSYPDLSFQLGDARSIESGCDLLFSNACLQWVPDHAVLIPGLMQKLNPGGVLAVQIPMNQKEPLYQIIAETAEETKWGFSYVQLETNETLKPEEYYDILSDCSSEFHVWETIYCHSLPDHQALVDWVKGTRLRPYLNALSPEQAALFEKEIAARAAKVYPVQKDGKVLLHFRRFFFTAVK